MKTLLIGLLACASLTHLASSTSSPARPAVQEAARAAAPEGQAAPRAVFFLRHAETSASTSSHRDPELSEAGLARAEDLARLLSHAGVTHLFSSEFQRTQGTLAPLAEHAGLEVRVVPARAAKDLLSALRDLPEGSVAVVAGHSNTVPQLVAAVGGEARDLVDHPTYGGMLAETSYDRLFLVTGTLSTEGEAVTVELRYGPPS